MYFETIMANVLKEGGSYCGRMTYKIDSLCNFGLMFELKGKSYSRI